jgi:DNA gyrase subunit B
MMPPQNQQNSNLYDASKIIRLEPREHVRMRPGMYIGGTDKRALHYLLIEVLRDPMSEFENTSYNQIIISLLPDKVISIEDDGVGIPLAKSEALGISILELHFTKLGQRSLGRPELNPKVDNSYDGYFMNWITPVMTALSSFCQVEVKREGFLWRQSYSEGLPTSPLEQIRPLEADESTGTSIQFKPDFSIFEENDFDFDLIASRCQELAYLLPQLRFTILDKRETTQEISYHYPQGLLSWLKAVSEIDTVMIAPMSISYECKLQYQYRQNEAYVVKVHLAFQWFWGEKQQIASYVNTIPTIAGGKHVNSLKESLVRQIGLRWNILEDGFTAIIHLLHPDPHFESQTQIRLLNMDAATAVEEAIEALFAAHPEAKAAIQEHFKLS